MITALNEGLESGKIGPPSGWNPSILQPGDINTWRGTNQFQGLANAYDRNRDLFVDVSYDVAEEVAIELAGAKGPHLFVETLGAVPTWMGVLRRTSPELSQLGKRRLAKELGKIPRSAQPVSQGRFGEGTRWWEYLDLDGNRKIVVEHPDKSVHVGRPKPQSKHLDGSGPPKYYPIPGTGHVGE